MSYPVSDKVWRYRRISHKGRESVILLIGRRVPFGSTNYSLSSYYGLDANIVHALGLTDRTTIEEFFSHCCSEAKIDVLKGAEYCLIQKTYPRQDKIAFYNWIMTLMTPLEIKKAQE